MLRIKQIEFEYDKDDIVYKPGRTGLRVDEIISALRNAYPNETCGTHSVVTIQDTAVPSHSKLLVTFEG